MPTRLSDDALATLFLEARTHNTWSDRAVSRQLLEEVWNVARMGATSANCSPARIVFVTTPTGREMLKPCLSPGNLAKTMAAPVTAIIGQDMKFYDRLPELFPHEDARSWFAGKPDVIAATAFRNSTLQGAYLMLAARAMGLDCGPMSGFDAAKIDRTFFADSDVKSNFLCNIGYGTPEGLHPRGPRLAFDDACRVV